MTLSNEKIREILEGAPDGASQWDGLTKNYYDVYDEFNLAHLREILTLRQRVEELAAHVELLRDAYSYLENDADPHGEIFAILSSTPTTSLNAVRREFFIEGAVWEREQSYHLDIDDYANQRYPDKE